MTTGRSAKPQPLLPLTSEMSPVKPVADLRDSAFRRSLDSSGRPADAPGSDREQEVRALRAAVVEQEAALTATKDEAGASRDRWKLQDARYRPSNPSSCRSSRLVPACLWSCHYHERQPGNSTWTVDR